MWATLLFISDKLYNPEKEEEFNEICRKLDKFCLLTEIPETFYLELTDDVIAEVQEKINLCRNEEYIQYLKEELANTTDADYISCLNERLEVVTGPTPTIEEYLNAQDEYTVRDGKLYTTRNYVDGIFDSIALRETSNRTSKEGTTQIVMQRKDFAMIDSNFNDVSLVIVDKALVASERKMFWSEDEQM